MPERPLVHRQALDRAVLLTIPEPSVPIVRFSLVLRQGALADPEGKAGLTRVMLELLLRGTRRRGRVEWNRALERLGSQVGVTVASDLALVHGITLARNLAATLELVAEALAEPTLAGVEREDLVAELVEFLRSERDDDEALVDLFWRRALYPGHPMARRPSGESADLLGLGDADVQASYDARWRTGDLVLAVAGDLTPERARAALAPIVARFAADPVPAAPLPAFPEPAGLHILVVDKPERTQVQAALGRSAAAGVDPDIIAFWLGVTAFGGTFTSRFTREVRDVRGWSYIAQAEFARRRAFRGPVVMRTAPSRTDVVDCLELEVQLFGELARGDLDDGAVEFARSYLLNRYPLEISTAADLLLPAVRNELLGFPPDELLRVPERLAAVTQDDVRASLRRHLDPERLVAVLVATADTLVPELERRFPAAHVEVVDYREGLVDPGGVA
jgi:zinc protease